MMMVMERQTHNRQNQLGMMTNQQLVIKLLQRFRQFNVVEQSGRT